MSDLKFELLGASVQGLFQDSFHPGAQLIRDQGVWADPLRALYCGIKWSPLFKQCLRLVFSNCYPCGTKLHRWGYQLNPVCPFCQAVDAVYHRV